MWPCQPWCNPLRRRPSLFSYNNNEIPILISRIALKYLLFSFHVHNVVKETCTPSAELLSDFDMWPHTYRFRNFNVRTSLWGHGNHGGARRVVVLFSKQKWSSNFWLQGSSWNIFRSFCVHNVAKETCALTTELLTEFDGVQEGRKEGRTHIAYRFTVISIEIANGNRATKPVTMCTYLKQHVPINVIFFCRLN